MMMMMMTVQVAEQQKCVIDKMYSDLQLQSDTHTQQLQSVTQLYENQLHDNSATVNQLTVC